jgi:hypothetical protein
MPRLSGMDIRNAFIAGINALREREEMRVSMYFNIYIYSVMYNCFFYVNFKEKTFLQTTYKIAKILKYLYKQTSPIILNCMAGYACACNTT